MTALPLIDDLLLFERGGHRRAFQPVQRSEDFRFPVFVTLINGKAQSLAAEILPQRTKVLQVVQGHRGHDIATVFLETDETFGGEP